MNIKERREERRERILSGPKSQEQLSTTGSAIIRQGTFLAVSSLLVRAMNIFYRIPVTNLWGDQGLGTYSDAYQIYSYFLVLASFSIPSTLARMISERLARKQYRSVEKIMRLALKVVLVIGGASMLVMMLFCRVIANGFLNNPDAARPIFFLGPTVLICSFMSLISGYFQGRNNMLPCSIATVLEGVVHAVLAVGLAYVLYPVSLGWSVTGAILGTGIGAAVGLVYEIACVRRYRKLYQPEYQDDEVVDSNKALLKEMLGLMIPITISSTIFSLKVIVDASMFGKLMISNGVDSDIVVAMRGIYNGKFVPLINIPISIGDSFGTAAVPSIAMSQTRGRYDELQEKITFLVKMSLIIAVPFTFGMIVLGKPMIRLLFSSAPLGGELFWVGAFSVVFYCVNKVATGVLQGLNKPQYPMYVGIFSTVVTCLFNVVTIKVFRLGIYSLPVNVMLFSFLLMVLNMHFALKYTKARVNFMSLSKGPLICSLLMALGCVLFYILTFAITGSNAISTVVAFFAGVFLYFSLMFRWKFMGQEELDSIPGGRYLKVFRW